MLTPDRIPVAAGKKMANILKKYPFGPRKEGNRLSTKISAGRRKLWSGADGFLPNSLTGIGANSLKKKLIFFHSILLEIP